MSNVLGNIKGYICDVLNLDVGEWLAAYKNDNSNVAFDLFQSLNKPPDNWYTNG